MPEENNVLVIRDLVKKFGGYVAISNVNLSLERGGVISLLGPSGCGKTTTLRCIAGFYGLEGGSISIGGRLVASPSVFVPPEERNLAMVFQNYVLWPHMTAFQNIAYGLRLRRVPRAEIEKRVKDVMRVLGLAGLEDRYPHALSGGQQQRVSVARSLIVEPEVLLLDEPFSNLDAQLRIEMRQEMRSLLKRFGTTAIYVTHDQEEAMVLSDRIVLMNSGKVVQAGTPVDLYERPNSRFTAQFFGVTNFLPAVILSGQDSSRVRVDGLDVVLRASERPDFAADGRVLVGIRDCDVDVSPASPKGEDWVTATVLGRTYLGGDVLLDLQCNGIKLQARVSGSAALAYPETVAVRLNDAKARLLPTETGTAA